MNTTRFITLLLSVVISATIYSQNRKKESSFFTASYYLDKNQVQYTPSDKLSLLKKDAGYFSYAAAKDYKGIPLTFREYFIPKDGSFVIYVEVAPICSTDSVHVDIEFGPTLTWKIDEMHINRIKADFGMNLNKKVGCIFLRDLPVSYKSSSYAKKTFNADTVITYPLKMWEVYKEKYNSCQVMIIQKKSRGYIAFYCFYNNRDKKKLNRYMKQMEGVFWYREPKDYIEVIKPQMPDTVIVLPHLKVKKKRIINR